MYLFIYTIVVYGIANALVYFNGPFNLIDKFRNWVASKSKTLEELFSCMFCLPTNIGFILSILALLSGMPFTPGTYFFDKFAFMWPFSIIFDGFYAGAITYLIHTIQQRIEGKEENTTELLID